MFTDGQRETGGSRKRRLQGLLLVLLAVTASVPASADGVSASEALNAKDRATDLRDELQSLDEQGPVSVDRDVLTTVDREIKKGKLAVESGEYEDAKTHFDRAIEQARAELVRSYTAGTNTLLGGTERYLDSLKSEGYTTAEMGVLRERLTKQRERLEAVDSLAASRTAYDDAQSLREDASELPRPTVVRAVSLVRSFWPLLLVVPLLGVAAVGVYVRANDREDDGPQLH